MIQPSYSHGAALLMLLGATNFACQNHGNGNGSGNVAKEDAAKAAPEDAGNAAQPDAGNLAGEGSISPQEPMEPRLRRIVPLSDLAREILKEPMRRHASTMRKLTWASVMLDYPSVEATANEMLAEPRVSRPISMEQGIFDISFSKSYLTMEDQLYDAAQSLRQAAASRDPLAMSAAYLEMAGTCLGCHATYLEMPGNP